MSLMQRRLRSFRLPKFLERLLYGRRSQSANLSWALLESYPALRRGRIRPQALVGRPHAYTVVKMDKGVNLQCGEDFCYSVVVEIRTNPVDMLRAIFRCSSTRQGPHIMGRSSTVFFFWKSYSFSCPQVIPISSI